MTIWGNPLFINYGLWIQGWHESPWDFCQIRTRHKDPFWARPRPPTTLAAPVWNFSGSDHCMVTALWRFVETDLLCYASTSFNKHIWWVMSTFFCVSNELSLLYLNLYCDKVMVHSYLQGIATEPCDRSLDWWLVGVTNPKLPYF